MKKVLFGDKGNFYKANLHCHTTKSDGRITPEKIKEEYAKRGYSIVAFTDHEFIVDHGDLCDDNFLAINSYEMAINTRRPGPGHEDYKFVMTYHLNLYKKTPGDLKHVFWNPGSVFCGDPEYVKTVEYVGGIKDKPYSTELINDLIKAAHENNFLVAYNHPRWSMQSYPDYCGLKDLDFLEIYNHGCYVVGNDDYVPHIYDDMLRLGSRLFCTCTDDNHNFSPLDDTYSDSFGGWVVVNAFDLKYETVINALGKGDFYASTGAEIKEITFENGKITVKCAPAKTITFTTGTRHAGIIIADNKTGLLTEGSFDVAPDDDYVRIEITDANGKKANSQAFFTDKLFD